MVPLKHLVRVNARTLAETTDPDFEFSYIDIGGVGRGLLLGQPERLTFMNAPSRARRLVQRHDTIVSTVRTYLRAHWTMREPGADLVASTGFAVLTPRPVLDPWYLGWLAQSDLVVEEVVARSVGVSYPAINPFEIGNVLVPDTPLPKQQAIAHFLDAETGCIDALIGKKRRLRSLLEERAALLLNDLVGADHIVPSDGVPVGIAGTESVRLGAVAQVQCGLTLDANRPQGPLAVSLPYLRVANVQDGQLDLSDLKEVMVAPELAARTRLRRGDVLMTEGGDPDKLGRGTVWEGAVDPCLHQNHVFAVRPKPSRLLPEYLALVTRSSYARRYFEVTATKTTGIASTSTSKVAAFRVPLPNVQVQRALVQRHHDASRLSQAVAARLSHQLSLLQEHRQALITAAVTGEMEVPGVTA